MSTVEECAYLRKQLRLLNRRYLAACAARARAEARVAQLTARTPLIAEVCAHALTAVVLAEHLTQVPPTALDAPKRQIQALRAQLAP